MEELGSELSLAESESQLCTDLEMSEQTSTKASAKSIQLLSLSCFAVPIRGSSMPEKEERVMLAPSI
jgi:hypothetical protein